MGNIQSIIFETDSENNASIDNTSKINAAGISCRITFNKKDTNHLTFGKKGSAALSDEKAPSENLDKDTP